MTKFLVPENYHKGFSLLEMIIVLSIIGILSSLTTQLLQPPSKRLEINNVTQALCSTLRHARGRAIATNIEKTVFIDVTNKKFTSSDLGYGIFPVDTLVLLDIAKPQSTEMNVGSITYFPDGTSTGGDIILKSSGIVTKISINWLTGATICHLN